MSEEAPAAPEAPVDPDATLKQNIARVLSLGERAHEETLGEGLIVSAGVIDMLVSTVRLLVTARWPAPTPPAPVAPPEGGTDA